MLALRCTRRCTTHAGGRLLVVLAATALGLATAGTGVAAAKPVPCSPAGAMKGAAKFNCKFYPAGNGISGGSPVLRSDGTRVGFLRKGTNFVLCQRAGATVRAGRYFNNRWAYTQADNRKYGWVNAVYASGGDNNGPFGGVPACAKTYGQPPTTTSAASMPPPSSPGLPTPEGGYASYHKELFINRLPRYDAGQLMAQFNSNVDGYFTFTGCGRHLELREICQLRTPIGNAPVEVIAVTGRGFALRSLPGHPEGAGRTIRFEFRPSDVVGNLTLKQLVIDAWGPVSAGSVLGPFNAATVAEVSWQIMAENINTRFPQDPPPAGVVI